MTEFVLSNIYLIILLPFFAAIFIPAFSLTDLYLSRRFVFGLSIFSSIFCVLFSTIAMLYCINNPHFILENNFSWLDFSHLGLNFEIGTLVDNLSTFFIFIVSTVSLLVQIFSNGYMKNDTGFNRFFALLNFFIFAMLGLALSSNLIQTYLFWELVGVASYLLIGFWTERRSASRAAKKAFLINRFGDVCFLFGIVALIYYVYNFDISQGFSILSFVNISIWSNSIFGLTDTSIFNLICAMLLMGSIAKSAQFPLHVWLEDAMQAPTPVSALIHAATMVAAGVFLIARLYPLYSLSQDIMLVILWIGLFTALFTGFIAIFQNDIKKLLAFSTCSQLGLMFFALGSGAFSQGLFHLMTHAYFKALLFLVIGAVLTATSHQQNMKFLGGLRKQSPICAATFLTGAIALSGLLFSGAQSKKWIYLYTYENLSLGHFTILLILTFMTTFYIFKAYFMIFEGEQKTNFNKKKISFSMNFSLSVFVILVLTIGLVFSNIFQDYIFFETNNKLANISSEKNIIPALITYISSLSGLILAFWAHRKHLFQRIEPSSNLFWKIVSKKFYIEKFYSFLNHKVFMNIVKIFSFIEKNIIENIVQFLPFITNKTGSLIAKLQTGNVQAYLACTIFVVGALLLVLTWVYYWMMKV